MNPASKNQGTNAALPSSPIASRKHEKDKIPKSRPAKPVEKPKLMRSHSLYSPLSNKFPANVHSSTNTPSRHAASDISANANATSKEHPKTSPTSSIYLQGSAKLQRFPTSRQDPFRANSFSRLSRKSGSVSSTASTISSPSSPSSTAQITPYYYHHHPSISSSMSPAAQKLLADQHRNIYKVQEKAYIKKMNNEYTDDYATKAIDTKYDRLDIVESDSEGSESEYLYDEESETDDHHDESLYDIHNRLERSPTVPTDFSSLSPIDSLMALNNYSLRALKLASEASESATDPRVSLEKFLEEDMRRTVTPPTVSSVQPTSLITLSNAAGKIDNDFLANLQKFGVEDAAPTDTEEIEQVVEEDEFKEIFGDADAEEAEDNNITYAAEISRIASEKLNDAFQIDDSIIYPLIKPKLRPELLEDQKFLERFEWQIMLGVVIKSDIVTAEKKKMMKKLNFGTNEENINIVNAHGSEAYLSSFFINQYKENLWISLKAKKYSRDIIEQKRILSFSRSLMDEVIEEIMTFRYNKEDAEKQFYSGLVIDGLFGPDVDISVLEQDYKSVLQLTSRQQLSLDAYLYQDANKVIQTLLDKYDNCEQLWITHEEMYVAKPVLRTEAFAKRLEALISWKNIIGALYSEKEILIKWFKNDTYYRNNIEPSTRLGRHSSASSLARDNETVIDESISDAPSEVACTEESVDNCEYGSELNPAMFAENILNYKNLAEMVDKKIFSVINPWSKKAKESYLSSKEIFEEINLPSFLPILLELVKFPSYLIKEVVRIRLQYAKSVTQQTLMGIDQTIYDFKVIIKLCFQVKENLFRFLNGVPDIDPKNLEIDYEESDTLLLDFIDYLLVLFHRKLLDSSRSPYSFTTYKEPEILEKEWQFLKNIGYFLEINSGFKVSRNFLFLISRLVARLLNYIDHQLDHPSLENKLKFIKWYTTSFDNYNNVKRSLTRFTNSSIKMVQNSLILHCNFNKDLPIAKILLLFLRKRNHALITINGTANLYDILYNKGKTHSDTNKIRKNIMIFVFASEELLNAPDKEIIGTLQGSKLGCDLTKPSLDSLNVNNNNSGTIKVVADSSPEPGSEGYPANPDVGPDAASVHSKTTVSADKEASPGYGEDKRFGAKAGYLIVLPLIRHVSWKGKVRNIDMPEKELSAFPKLVAARYGNALLLTHGSPFNLGPSKNNFMNNLKRYYVEECDPPSHLLQDIRSPRNSVDYAVKLFDKLTTTEEVSSDTKETGNTAEGKRVIKLIKTLHTEPTCSLLQIQKELVKINRNYNRMSYIILEKGLRLKDQILLFIYKNRDESASCLEILNNLFYIIRDTSLLSLKNIEPGKRGVFIDLMIKASIEWIKAIVDDCIATEQKTFRWCVSALEFAVLIFQKFNVLLLTDEQFSILKAKVAGCLSLLISHFDIMGARSNKADKVLLSISKLQRKAIQKENTLALHKNTELSEKIVQLDKELTEKLHKFKAIGKVLDNEKSENKFLTYLSSSFSKFSSKWQKGDYLGGGSFGSVYTATDLTNGNVMAVKEVKFPNSQMVTNIGKVIKDEMTVLEMLNHPNIVHYFGVEVHSDKVYLFMEYCECGSLDSLLRHGRIADERLIQWYTFQMVEGLAYLHLHNITHRDIKPENILLNRLGVIKFVDFGAAKVIASTGRTRNMNLTRSLHGNQTGITGTPMYLSPESITGHADQILGSADIWALGCCVLEMCTGRRPWSKLDNEYAIMFHIANGNKPQLPEHGELSPEGINFLNKCFESRPEKRATAEELINDPWLADMRAQQVGYESNTSSTDLSESN